MTAQWSVSTDSGSTLRADELVGVLTTHHHRVVEAWRGFSPAQWEQPSRNPLWTVHDTARHVADAMEMCQADVCEEPPAFGIEGFDPRTTPLAWLTSSVDDPPTRTIERFDGAARRVRARVGERVAARDASVGTTVYGPAHWSVGVVHVFWDSWLHERDVLLPLGLPAVSSVAEQRLVGLYGLLMAMLPAKMMQDPFEATVRFTGSADHVVTAAHDAGRLASTERQRAETDLIGDLASVIDSLAGRGEPVAKALPGAPDPLGLLAAFFTS